MQKRLRAEKCALIVWTDGMAQVLTVVLWVLFDKFDNLGKAQAGLVQVPVLCAHGTDDEIVPFSQGVALKAFGERAELLALPRGAYSCAMHVLCMWCTDPSLFRWIVPFALIHHTGVSCFTGTAHRPYLTTVYVRETAVYVLQRLIRCTSTTAVSLPVH